MSKELMAKPSNRIAHLISNAKDLPVSTWVPLTTMLAGNRKVHEDMISILNSYSITSLSPSSIPHSYWS